MFKKVLVAVMLGTIVVFISTLMAQEQIIMEPPPLDAPQPQLFCGYCHMLTYPKVIQKSYDLWKKGKHNQIGCVECHYPPTGVEYPTKAPQKGTGAKPVHIPQKALDRFSFLPLGSETILTRPIIADTSCMTAACHGRADDKFKTKKIKFTEKVFFVHKSHLDKKNQIEGQQLNCTSCHQHESDQKKFEVTEASCHLCHFKNVEFNKKRGRCELCHELPQKPIQTSGEKPITHQILKDAQVSCASCHMDVVQGSGEAKFEAFFENGILNTAMVLGSGGINRENCLTCHDQEKELKKNDNKKLMHQKHVTVKNARCFNCHEQLVHANADLKGATADKPSSLDLNRAIQSSCRACHPEPHRYQRLLAEGAKRDGVLAAPDPMFKVRTNCLGCHNEKKNTEKGMPTLFAASKSCVQCHTKDHERMLADWKNELSEELKYALEIEAEALETLNNLRSKNSTDNLNQAQQLFDGGRQYLNMVEFGNGVHNKKYSIILIDAAINKFDDMIDYVGSLD